MRYLLVCAVLCCAVLRCASVMGLLLGKVVYALPVPVSVPVQRLLATFAIIRCLTPFFCVHGLLLPHLSCLTKQRADRQCKLKIEALSSVRPADQVQGLGFRV